MIAALPLSLTRFYIDETGAACEQPEDARLEIALVMKPKPRPGGAKTPPPHVSLQVWGDTGKYVMELPLHSAAALVDRLTPIVNSLVMPRQSEGGVSTSPDEPA